MGLRRGPQARGRRLRNGELALATQGNGAAFGLEGGGETGELQGAQVSAQGVTGVDGSAFPERVKVALGAGVEDDVARVVEVVLPEEGALRTHCALDERRDEAFGREPADDVAGPRPRVNGEADRLGSRGFASHQAGSPISM